MYIFLTLILGNLFNDCPIYVKYYFQDIIKDKIYIFVKVYNELLFPKYKYIDFNFNNVELKISHDRENHEYFKQLLK